MKRILIVFLLFSLRCYSQEPSHFIIGEKELSGVNVYDIFHDDKGDYWIATNNGLYKYDCFEFSRIPIEKAKSNSVFAFKLDKNKELYCHNFAGQIFKIKNDSALLVFQVPPEEIFRSLDYGFTKGNRMTIISKNVFFPKDSNEIVLLQDKDRAPPFQFFNYKDELYFIALQYQTLKVFHVEEEKTVFITEITNRSFDTPRAIETANGVAIYNNREGLLIGWFDGEKIVKTDEWKGQKELKSILFSLGEDLFITTGTGGIYNSERPDEVYFQNNIISCFIEDNEGNKLAGTFGEGILVIPNMDVKNLLFDNRATKAAKICDLNGELYVGTKKGELFKIHNNKPIGLIVDSKVQIELLESMPSENKLMFNSSIMIIYDPETKKKENIGVGSPKSLMEVFPQEYLFSTNDGLLWYDPQGRNRHNHSLEFKNGLAHITNFNERSYAACYDTINRIFYAGNVLGLKIGTIENAELFKINGNPLICYDMQMFEGKVYVATRNNGVLIFENGNLIDQWRVRSGFISDEVKKIKVEKNVVYGTTRKEFFQADLNGNILKSITRSDGLNSNNITDFEIIENDLWLVSDNRLQKIPLNSIKRKKYIPVLNYLTASCNEEQVFNGSEFDARNNKFNFSFACKSLKHKEDISYSYCLKGLEENWTTLDHTQRAVEYKSLPSGSYTFEVQAQCQGEISEKKVFSFTVLAPFWLRTWFIVLVAATFVFVVLLIYFIQKRRYQRKLAIKQKLAKSQLSTLKSQMNPHFIFNSLNSVQDLILQEKKEGAYKYISKFALLVRKTLNQSDAEFIDFEEEIALLDVYLELEQLRFKKDLVYKIEFGDIEDVEIPPMLIQPIVENAIKHGLLHKKGQKDLKIVFKKEGKIIICRVIDNGIGREKAIEIKARQSNQNESFALNSIETRMELLKEAYNEDLGVEYVDLKIDDEAIGTEVIIKFPFKNKF